jgi:hypothetical protein
MRWPRSLIIRAHEKASGAGSVKQGAAQVGRENYFVHQPLGALAS